MHKLTKAASIEAFRKEGREQSQSGSRRGSIPDSDGCGTRLPRAGRTPGSRTNPQGAALRATFATHLPLSPVARRSPRPSPHSSEDTMTPDH